MSSESRKGAHMRVQRGPVLVLMMVLELVLGAVGATDPRARALVADAARAMGGEERLRVLHALEIKGIGHRYMLEQSERPEGPWLMDYFQVVEKRDLAESRIRRDTSSRGCDSTECWKSGDWSVSTLVVADHVAALFKDGKASPGRAGVVQTAEESLILGPDQAVL
jgi:hypothetical protein